MLDPQKVSRRAARAGSLLIPLVFTKEPNSFSRRALRAGIGGGGCQFRGFRDFIKKKHGIIQQPKAVASANMGNYRIQIMASRTPVSLDNFQFKQVGIPVEEVKLEGNTSYKYKYYVGRFLDKKEAKKALNVIHFFLSPLGRG